MPLPERYRHQVALLIETLPFVAAERDFALKGGTAINLHRLAEHWFDDVATES